MYRCMCVRLSTDYLRQHILQNKLLHLLATFNLKCAHEEQSSSAQHLFDYSDVETGTQGIAAMQA